MERKLNWLLRIGGEVIGPLTESEVCDRILARQVTGIDEVALPCSSWYYIRDVNQFIGILEKANLNKSSTSSSSMTGSKGKTLTHTAQLDDKTQDLVDVIRMDPTQPIEDNNIAYGNMQNVQNEKAAVLNLDKMRERGQDTKKSKSRFGLFLTCFLVLLLAGGAYFFKDKLFKIGKASFSDPYKEAKENWITGNFRAALIGMKTSARAGKLKKDLQLPYAALLLLQEQNHTQAEKVLSEQENKNTADWKNLSGLVRFYKKDQRGAEKFFLNALGTSNFYLPSLTNLGLVYRKRKDWPAAKAYFESAYSKGAETDLAAFLLAESWARLSMAKGELSELQSIQTFLNNHITMASSYAYELNFLQLWIKRFQGLDVRDNLNDILMLDPYLTDLRKQNPFNYRLSFSSFSYICNDINSSKNVNNKWAAVYSLCMVLAGEEGVANQNLERALGLDRTDPKLLALKSLVLDLTGDSEGASLALSESIENNIDNKEMLPLYMQAHFCQRRGDYKCSAKFWQLVIDKDSQSATAYAGLAKAYLEVGSVDKSRNLLTKAGALNSDLRSYLELKTRLAQIK